MRANIIKILKLIVGLFLFSLGIVMTINANLGLAPWDVFHQGLTNILNITMGRANIYVGIVIITLNIVLGQAIGWGTLVNMVLIGTFMDILMLNNLVPSFKTFLPSLIMLLLGILVSGYGCFVYLSAALGAGPRDGLMVALTKKTNKSVRLVKSSIEICVVSIGYLLGGKVGIGTLIMALSSGIIFQFAFNTVNFSVKDLEHRLIPDDIEYIKKRLTAKEQEEETKESE